MLYPSPPSDSIFGSSYPPPPLPPCSNYDNPNESYLEIWHQTFTNNEVMADYQDIVHIFKILIIVPFINAYEGLDWIHLCVSKKKGLVSKILSLIALSIIGGQGKKDVSSLVHIVIMQKSILIWFPQSMLICQHLRYLIWKTLIVKSVFPYRYICL